MQVAAVVMGIWLAPTANANTQDQAFLSFLAAHNVAVDPNTAINAAHVACAQVADGVTTSVVAAVVDQQFPTIGGNAYWVAAAAQTAYCPS
ncbi:MAG TPA: DUF732 domain-containing protein [Mycobacterium sp.]|jgi:hypothetical protein|nr:DUF732 domain-containing protein [Mycobacterium sp.]